MIFAGGIDRQRPHFSSILISTHFLLTHPLNSTSAILVGRFRKHEGIKGWSTGLFLKDIELHNKRKLSYPFNMSQQMSQQVPNNPSSQAIESANDRLTRIQGGSAYLFEAATAKQFLQWWETTAWAKQLHENLSKVSSAKKEKICDPRWESTNRTAKQWSNYGQGAYVTDGKPFVFCLACNTALQHPRAFNVGTSHMSGHMTSAKCLQSSGRAKQTVRDMLSKVSCDARIVESLILY